MNLERTEKQHSSDNLGASQKFSEEFQSSSKILDGRVSKSVELPDLQITGGNQTSKDHLKDSLSKNFKASTLHNLIDNMSKFEQRAKQNQLSQKQIDETYKTIDRILSCKEGPLTEDLRRQVVRETMQHLGDPTVISQGGHNTCNVTAIQDRAYVLHPEKASKLIADIATKGEFQSALGPIVKLNREDFFPDKEARKSRPEAGLRDYATQLFNVTAVNLYYQAAKPDWRYKQIIENDPTTHKEHLKEGLFDKNGRQVSQFGHTIDGPGLGANAIAYINDAIVGKHEKYAVLSFQQGNLHRPGTKDLGVTSAEIGDEENFRHILKDLKDKHQLPAIGAVEVGVYPLNIDSGAPVVGYENGGHVVNFTDMQNGSDAKTSHVSMDNEWSLKEDHLDKSVNLHDAYLCVAGKQAARLDAFCELDEAENKHKPVPPAALLSLFSYDGPEAWKPEFKDSIKKVVDLAASERALTGEVRQKWFAGLRTYLGEGSNDERLDALQKIQKSKACTEPEVGQLTADAAMSISIQKKHALKHHDEAKRQDCAKSTTKIAEFVLSLSPEAKKNYYVKIREGF
ncbi:MAG: hypothetical protein K2X27_23325 [Candidatus Obscuribacterales bacterium]|nr:hypothetical protein [Candidatus Obscuribacterales bacterium]